MTEPIQAIYAVWGVWAASWFVAAIWSRRTEARPAVFRSLSYYFFVFVGAGLLFSSPPSAVTWDMSLAYQRLLLGLVIAGFAFAWWARIHLGTLWSGTVTKKAGHHVVDTGPYRLVRHPIYTGIILSAFATAAAKETPVAFAGAGIMAFGWFLKARLEERFLREQLGADAYGAYAKRVPMLVPFL